MNSKLNSILICIEIEIEIVIELSLRTYIEIEIENLGFFILRKVLVSTTPTSAFRKSFLLGLSDLNRLKIDMDFRTKRVRFGVGPNAGKWIKMKNYL